MIIARAEDGGIAALLNRCTHRGTLLCPVAHGSAARFQCAYHGWTFTNTGRLVAITYPDGYRESFDVEGHDLGRMPRVESYGGFVFGSLDPDVECVADWLGSAMSENRGYASAGTGRNGGNRLACFSRPVSTASGHLFCWLHGGDTFQAVAQIFGQRGTFVFRQPGLVERSQLSRALGHEDERRSRQQAEDATVQPVGTYQLTPGQQLESLICAVLGSYVIVGRREPGGRAEVGSGPARNTHSRAPDRVPATLRWPIDGTNVDR